MAILAASMSSVYSCHRVKDTNLLLSLIYSNYIQNEQKDLQKRREEMAKEKGYDSWYAYMDKEGPR